MSGLPGSGLERLEELLAAGGSQTSSLQSGAHLTLGLVYAQQGKLDGAVESLARAVTLDGSQRQAATILENVYYARNESLDGLDDYIRSVASRERRRNAEAGEATPPRLGGRPCLARRAGKAGGGPEGDLAGWHCVARTGRPRWHRA